MGSELRQLVVTAKIVEVIAEINSGIAVMRHQHNNLPANAGGFLVTSLPSEVTLTLAHDSRLIVHRAGSAIEPGSSKVQLVPLNSVIGAAGNHKGHLRRKFIGMLVILFRFSVLVLWDVQ